MLKLYVAAQNLFTRTRDEEQGATATEYALLVVLIAAALVATVITFESWLGARFNVITSKF